MNGEHVGPACIKGSAGRQQTLGDGKEAFGPQGKSERWPTVTNSRWLDVSSKNVWLLSAPSSRKCGCLALELAEPHGKTLTSIFLF